MILMLLGIMALLTVGLIVIMAVSVGWWLIPVAILLLLFRKCLEALKALFRGKDDVITMTRKEFEANYMRRPNT